MSKEKNLIKELQNQLKVAANKETKVWFENYLKGAISYYGVKSPYVKILVEKWQKKNKISSLSLEKQIQLCKDLMSLPRAEEKFAGIIYLQYNLVKIVETKILLDMAEWCFENDCFCDWSTADWFTIRVLANIVKKGYF